VSDKAMREEMLEELDRCWVIPLEKGAAVKDIWESSGFKAREAIRALIEHGPEVSRKKISQLLVQRPSWDTEVCIMQYLRERGVTVKEGKDE